MKRMKKSLSMFLFMLIAVAGVFVMAPAKKVAAAEAYIKKLPVNCDIKKYDITGDRKADKINITYSKYNKEEWWYEELLIYINDRPYVIPFPKNDSFNNFSSVQCKLIKLKNGKAFLHMAAYGLDEYDCFQSIYQFTGKSMKNVLKMYKPMNKFSITHSDVIKVKDNTITMRQLAGSLPKFGIVTYNFNFKYKDGKFVRTSDVGNVTHYMRSTGYKTISKNVTWYTGKGCTKKKSSSLKKGTKAKPVQIYLTSKGYAVKIKTKSGKMGWIKGTKSSGFTWNQAIFKEADTVM